MTASTRTTVPGAAGGGRHDRAVDPLAVHDQVRLAGLGRTVELDQYTTVPSVTEPADTFTGHYTVTPGANTVQPRFYGWDAHGNQSTITQAPADRRGRPSHRTHQGCGSAVSPPRSRA